MQTVVQYGKPHTLSQLDTHTLGVDVYASPAVDHDGVIASPPLHLGHLLNDISDSLQV